MFYVFYGSDAEKARARAKAVLAVMQQKRPDAEYFRMTSENWSPVGFEELIGGQGLFERKNIIFADGTLEIKDAKEFVLERVEAVAQSDNAFVFLESKIDAASLKKIEKFAQEVKKFEKPAVPFSRSFGDFNIFSLGDALGKRSRSELWTLLVKAFMNGASAEEVNGILFWQVKSMLASKDAPSAAAAGLSPFVYTKSKRYAQAFTDEELRNLSRVLLCAYHDAHRGLSDLEISLEQLALKV